MFLLIALGAPAWAQPASVDAPPLDIESGEPGVLFAARDQISVYATRQPLNVFDFPGQVSVIDQEAIDALQPSSAADIFVGVPGMRFAGGARRTGQTPVLRGRTGEGVLVLFDGARQSFSSAHDGRFFIAPELLQTVEVLRGPASALYGSGAMGGALALQSISATDLLDDGARQGAKLRVGHQSVHEGRSISGTVFARTESGKLDGLVNLGLREAGDIELGSGLELPSDNEIFSGLFKGNVHFSEAASFSSSVMFYRDDAQDPNNPEGNLIAGEEVPITGDIDLGGFSTGRPIPGPAIQLVDREVSNYTVQNRFHFAPANNPLLDLSISAYYTNNEVKETEVESSCTRRSGCERELLREVSTWGLGIENHSRFDDLPGGLGLVLSTGLDWYEDDQNGSEVGANSITATDSDLRGGVPDAEQRFIGGYVQAAFEAANPAGLPGTLRFIPGLRYDDFETTADGGQSSDDSELSWKAGMSYAPVDWLLLFGNYAEAFRAPSFNELFATGVHFPLPLCPNRDANAPGTYVPFTGTNCRPMFRNNRFVANPALEAEDSEGFEFGVGFEFADLLRAGDSLTLKGSRWDSDVNNLLEQSVRIPAGCLIPIPAVAMRAPCNSAGTTIVRNVGEAELDGVEIEAWYEHDRVYARATWSAIDGKDAAGAHVGVLSPDRLFVDLGVRLYEFDLSVGLRLTVADKFDEVNPDDAGNLPIRGSYQTIDLYAFWTPQRGLFRGFRFDLAADNLSDEDYELVATGASQPGRNIKLGMRWQTAW